MPTIKKYQKIYLKLHGKYTTAVIANADTVEETISIDVLFIRNPFGVGGRAPERLRYLRKIQDKKGWNFARIIGRMERHIVFHSENKEILCLNCWEDYPVKPIIYKDFMRRPAEATARR